MGMADFQVKRCAWESTDCAARISRKQSLWVQGQDLTIAELKCAEFVASDDFRNALRHQNGLKAVWHALKPAPEKG